MARILLVEDDATLSLSLEVSLAAQGHEVTCCRLLADAQQTAADQAFDLVLLDLGLPDGDGLELCRTLRRRGSILPILMLTARGTIEARVEGLSFCDVVAAANMDRLVCMNAPMKRLRGPTRQGRGAYS